MARIRQRIEKPAGITGISVSGYKSLRDPQHIDVKPLTIIAGVNSSGKSSIVQPLLLLKQTIEAPYDPGPLLLNGPNVSVTRIEQILSRGASRQSAVKDFTVAFTVGESEIKLRFGKARSGDLRLIELTATAFDGEVVSLNERMSSKELLANIPEHLIQSVGSFWRQGEMPPANWSIKRDRWSLEIQVRRGDDDSAQFSHITLGPDIDDHEYEIGRLIHLPAFRGNPKRTYPTAAIEGQFPGQFNEYTQGS